MQQTCTCADRSHELQTTSELEKRQEFVRGSINIFLYKLNSHIRLHNTSMSFKVQGGGAIGMHKHHHLSQ